MGSWIRVLIQLDSLRAVGFLRIIGSLLKGGLLLAHCSLGVHGLLTNSGSLFVYGLLRSYGSLDDFGCLACDGSNLLLRIARHIPRVDHRAWVVAHLSNHIGHPWIFADSLAPYHPKMREKQLLDLAKGG